MASVMRWLLLLLFVSVLGSAYVAPLNGVMKREIPSDNSTNVANTTHLSVLQLHNNSIIHPTTSATEDTTTAQDGSTEIPPTTTGSLPTPAVDAVPSSSSTGHPVASSVAVSTQVKAESPLPSEITTTGRPDTETSPPVTGEAKRGVAQEDSNTTPASTAAAMAVSTISSVEVFPTGPTTSAAADASAVHNTASTSTERTTTAVSTSTAQTPNAASTTVTAKSDTVGTSALTERQGKSLSEEDKATPVNERPTAVATSTGTASPAMAAHFTEEEAVPRKPLGNLLAQWQQATSVAGTEPAASHSAETTLPSVVASTTLPSTDAHSMVASTTLPLTDAHSTVASTSVTTAADTRTGKAINVTAAPAECSILLNSTLLQHRELFVPEELLSDTESLPTAFATGRVAQWAQGKCTEILSMLQPLNETCEKEIVDRVAKFRSVALTTIWDYLCARNATNLTVMANQPSTCLQGLPSFSKQCGSTNKLGFEFHFPSELVLTPRVLKEGDCRNVNSTTACLKDQIRTLQSSCAAVQKDHMAALLDLLLKSVQCDRVPPTPPPPKNAATRMFYSLWSLVLAVVLAGFYW